MAGELVYPGNPGYQTGLSVTASVYTMAGSSVSTGISCTESGTTANYVGNMPSASAGRYIVKFFSGSLMLGQGLMEWDGSAEITLSGVSGRIPAALTAGGNMKADTLALAGQTVSAAAGVTFPSSVASPTNITAASGVSLAALDSPVQLSGTASAGAAGSITLAGGSATNDLYVGNLVKVYGGTGAGQARVITAYDGTTKVATVSRNWATAPDATSQFAVLAASAPKVDAALGVTTGTNSDKTGYALSATQTFDNTGTWTGNLSGTVTTVTNLTNAPTNGDLTATMKASVTTAATAATPTVLLTPGTGAGQVSLAAGVIDANTVTLAGQTVSAAAGVTFPSSVASPTNITAGTITTVGTVTDLTNLPPIPANWLTAAGIAAGALNGKGDWNVGKTGYSLTASYDPAKTAAQAGDAMALTAGERTATIAALNASTVDGTVTFLGMNRVNLAVLTGKTLGALTLDNKFYGQDGTTVRVESLFDSSGDRTSVTLNTA